jgi:signal recognition particle subunit SRP54
MFDRLQSKLSSVFKNISGKGKITEKNIKDALREVKLALLEADVNYKVVKEFVNEIKEKASGEKVIDSITPGQLFIKIVNDSLVEFFGKEDPKIDLSKVPSPIMVVGLQGSGKTTSTAKLAYYFKNKGKKVLLVAADTYRPAAIDQIKYLGKNIGVDVFSDSSNPIKIAKKAMNYAIEHGADIIIVDTAGRLHIDETMMQEVEKIKSAINPTEILLVVDAMTGQDAVNIAKTFNDRLDITGIILTKMDGDARGGAAISVKKITGKQIKFIGVSEKIEGLELFHPERIASRILGMGDIVSLVEKAKIDMDQKEAAKMEKKFKEAKFTLEDFLDQIKQLKKMGSLDEIIDMMPGGSKLKQSGLNVDEKEITKFEAVVNSMTKEERKTPKIINASRKKRIAKGSGTTIVDVNKVLKKYFDSLKVMKRFSKGKATFPFMKGLKF